MSDPTRPANPTRPADPSANPSWPSDDDLWASVDDTLRNVILPALTDEWARSAALQLMGVATYARERGADPHPARVAELAGALSSLGGNRFVSWDGEPNALAVMTAAGRALADAVSALDPDAAPAAQPDVRAEAEEVRRVLRPLLVAHLDDDLARSASTVPGFRGRLPEGVRPGGGPADA